MSHNTILRSDGPARRTRRPRTAALLAVLALAMTVLPSSAANGAAGSNIGGGVAKGTVTFDPLFPVPPGPACGETRFTLEGESQAVVVNTIIKGYAGNIDLSGSGGSTCETATGGAGGLTINAESTGNDFLSCEGLTGSYSRALTDVHAQLGGTCTVNDLSGIPVTLVFHGQFVPEGVEDGAGSEEPVTAAEFVGAYTLLPG